MEAVELDLQYVKQTFSRVMDQYTRPTKMRHFAWRILQNVSNLNMRQQNEITANKDQRFNKFYHRPLLEGYVLSCTDSSAIAREAYKQTRMAMGVKDTKKCNTNRDFDLTKLSIVCSQFRWGRSIIKPINPPGEVLYVPRLRGRNQLPKGTKIMDGSLV